MNVPVNKALYSRVKAEAKRKFKVYPSAYANAWLVREYKNVEELTARRVNVARSSGGLTRWFKEKWVDVKTGKPCGRQKGEKEAIQLADQVSESQVRHLRLLERCHQPKKQGLKEKKQVVKR